MTLALFGISGHNGTTIADQTPCTAANTGALQINNISGSVVKWVADTSFGGQYAIECTNVAGQAASVRAGFAADTTVFSDAYSFTCPALAADAANPVTILAVRAKTTATGASVGPVIIVQLLSTGQFDVKAGVSGTGTGQASLPAPKSQTNGVPAALVPGNRYRLELGATSSSGTVTARISNQNAAAGDYIGTTSTDTAAIATFTYTHSDLGLGSYPTPRTMRFSNARLENASAALLGPYVFSTPQFDITVTMTPDEATGETTATIGISRVGGRGRPSQPGHTRAQRDCDPPARLRQPLAAHHVQLARASRPDGLIAWPRRSPEPARSRSTPARSPPRPRPWSPRPGRSSLTRPAPTRS
jgi:hypothetical protein